MTPICAAAAARMRITLANVVTAFPRHCGGAPCHSIPAHTGWHTPHVATGLATSRSGRVHAWLRGPHRGLTTNVSHPCVTTGNGFGVRPPSMVGLMRSSGPITIRTHVRGGEMGGGQSMATYVSRVSRTRRAILGARRTLQQGGNRTPSPVQNLLRIHPRMAVASIVGVNCLVYAAWFMSEKRGTVYGKMLSGMYRDFTTSPNHLYDGRVYTLFTSAFSHHNMVHLGFNMLALWSFGTEVAATMGPIPFFLMYSTGAVVGSLCQVIDMSRDRTGHGPNVALGASGAVMSTIAYFVMTAPMRTIHLYGVVRVPAAVMGLGLMLYDVYGIGSQGTVGHSAHVGGALVGALWFALFRRPLRWKRS